MPVDLISATAFVCEKVLIEKDNVLSAIRLVDLFYATEVKLEEGKLIPPQPSPEKSKLQTFVSMSLLVNLKARPGYQASHSLLLRITNPAGEEKNVSDESVQADFAAKIPEVPSGFTLIAQLNIQPKVLGNYVVHVLLDGEEVCKAYFGILKHPQVEELVH
jgi:hypothetical protein